MSRKISFIGTFWLAALAACLPSCSTSDPNYARVLTSITVTPATADAQNFPDGQVVFTAAGTFNVAPSPGPVSSNPPYSGQFVVNNPATGAIANIVSTGNSTATVECVAGVSGTVEIDMSAYANNDTTTVIGGYAQLTCP
jgi:hypothetical protein